MLAMITTGTFKTYNFLPTKEKLQLNLLFQNLENHSQMHSLNVSIFQMLVAVVTSFCC